MNIPPHNPHLVVPTDGFLDPDLSNGLRARSAREAMLHYHHERGFDSDEVTCTIDLLTDLLHYLHSRGEDPIAANERARKYFEAEATNRKRPLDQGQSVIGTSLRATIEEGPLRVKSQGKSAEAIVGELLKQAEKKQKAGDVAQYLVGAKLAIRFNREIPVHDANKGDRKSHADTGARLGDFEIENSILEVAIGLPDEEHIQQIRDILEHSDHEIWLLTREDRVAIWKSETSKQFKSKQMNRIVVTSVESFVGQNITELAEFSASRKAEKFAELIEIYNSRWVDAIGVASIRISLE